MLTPDTHGTGTPAICCLSPSAQTKAEQEEIHKKTSLMEIVLREATACISK
jgi:hypothetical protein